MAITDNNKSNAIHIIIIDNEGVDFFVFISILLRNGMRTVAYITVCGMHEHGSLAPGGVLACAPFKSIAASIATHQSYTYTTLFLTESELSMTLVSSSLSDSRKDRGRVFNSIRF